MAKNTKSKKKAPEAAEPKYRQIASALLDEIRHTMKAGALLPPEARLAERFGVHVLTIRESLRLLQEGGVIERRRAVGTRVVNPLGGNWVTIVCDLDIFAPQGDTFFRRSVIYYLRRYLREAGIPSRVSVGEHEPGDKTIPEVTSLDFVADVEANRLAGVLALSTPPADWWLKKLQKNGVPVVGANPFYPYHVVFDPWDDLSKAIRTMMDFGRKRIAYIGWVEPVHRARQTYMDDRLGKALEDLERCYPVTIRKEWVKSAAHPLCTNAGWDEFMEIWNSTKEKPDGLIVDNEHFIGDIDRAVESLGIKVPEDLLIICHHTRGDVYRSRFPVIYQENDAMLFAYRMAEHFLRLYRGEPVASPRVAVPRMLIDDEVRIPRGPAMMPSIAPSAE